MVKKAPPERSLPHEFLFVERNSSPAVPLLERARRNYDNADLAEHLLWRARAIDRECLHVYFALYKFYFYRKQFDAAEKSVREGLAIAAQLGGFSEFIDHLTPLSTDWSPAYGAQRFFLFSLKALAFIRLRQGDREDSDRILAKLRELDPDDKVGGSVVGELATGSGLVAGGGGTQSRL